MANNPVIIQGTAVPPPSAYSASPYDHHKQPTEIEDPDVRYNDAPQYNNPVATPAVSSEGAGTKQPTRCNDPIFAFLLYGNIAAIAACVSIYGTDAFFDSVDSSSTVAGTSDSYDYSGYIYATAALGLISMIASGLTLPILMCIPEALVKMSLFFMVGLSGAMMVYSWLSGNFLMGIIGTVFFLIFLCYAKAVWSRIPFASVNLLTATTAIKKNLFSVIVAYVFIVAAFGWSLLWAIALAGISNKVIVESDTPL